MAFRRRRVRSRRRSVKRYGRRRGVSRMRIGFRM